MGVGVGVECCGGGRRICDGGGNMCEREGRQGGRREEGVGVFFLGGGKRK